MSDRKNSSINYTYLINESMYYIVKMALKEAQKKLKVKQYPTHLIVDSRGVIIKMVSNVKTLTYELNRILGK